ncbi:hypothetical protein SDJN03_18331, partial [Cucurbita argyrosperma subsp. sororia]
MDASRDSLRAVLLLVCKFLTVSFFFFHLFVRYLLASFPDSANAFDYSNKDMENVRRMLMTGIPLFNFKLVAANAFDYSNKDMENVRRMLMSVARHCVLKDRNSFVQFQASTGVEVLSS